MTRSFLLVTTPPGDSPDSSELQAPAEVVARMRRRAWILRGVTLLIVLAIVVLLPRFDDVGPNRRPAADIQDGEATTETTTAHEDPSTQSQAAEEEVASEAPSVAPDEPEEPEDPEIDNELNLAHDDIVRLGRAADIYGYGLGPGTSLDYDQATNFAYAVTLTCDGWRDDSLSFEDSVTEDVISGASEADATAMNRYLESTFCPAYEAAGN